MTQRSDSSKEGSLSGLSFHAYLSFSDVINIVLEQHCIVHGTAALPPHVALVVMYKLHAKFVQSNSELEVRVYEVMAPAPKALPMPYVQPMAIKPPTNTRRPPLNGFAPPITAPMTPKITSAIEETSKREMRRLQEQNENSIF